MGKNMYELEKSNCAKTYNMKENNTNKHEDEGEEVFHLDLTFLNLLGAVVNCSSVKTVNSF